MSRKCHFTGVCGFFLCLSDRDSVNAMGIHIFNPYRIRRS
jgi:hypothetical protein